MNTDKKAFKKLNEAEQESISAGIMFPGSKILQWLIQKVAPGGIL